MASSPGNAFHVFQCAILARGFYRRYRKDTPQRQYIYTSCKRFDKIGLPSKRRVHVAHASLMEHHNLKGKSFSAAQGSQLTEVEFASDNNLAFSLGAFTFESLQSAVSAGVKN